MTAKSADGSTRDNASNFARVPRRGATAEAVTAIQDMIRDGRLKAGERMPTERELAEALGLSRPTVREAIQSLASMNILDVRHGAGIFVASLDLTTLLAPLWFALELNAPTFDNLFEIRVTLEPFAAQLAAARATEEELRGLQEALKPLQEVGLDRERRLSADIELHRRIVEASHNELLIGVIASLTMLARRSRELTMELPGVERQAVGEHRALVEAIVRGDPEGARQMMLLHLSNVRVAAVEHRSELFPDGN